MARKKEVGRKLRGKKPFAIRILWGQEAVHEGGPSYEYAFDTEAELSAFMEGVDVAIGWMDYDVVEEGEDEE